MKNLYPTSCLRSLGSKDITDLQNVLQSSFTNVTSFKEYEDDERNIELLLLEHSTITVSVDWKWNAEDILWMLSKALPDTKLTLDSVSSNEDYSVITVSYTIDGRGQTISVDFDNPSIILESVNSNLQKWQFIELISGDDSYTWLRVPADFDISTYCKITGYSEDEKTKSAEPTFDHATDIEKPVTSSVFFKLCVYAYKQNNPSNGMVYLKFDKDGQEGHSASKAIAGESLKDAVGQALADYFGTYQGWSFIKPVQECDEVQYYDEVSNGFDVHVLIPYFAPGVYNLQGMTMKWVPADTSSTS